MKTHLFLSVIFLSLLRFSGSAQTGAALDFNNSYVQASTLSMGNTWTAEAWINPSIVSGGPYSIVSQCFWNNAEGFVMSISAGSVIVNGPQGFSLHALVTPGVWTHVAATFDNGVITLYKDGVIADIVNSGLSFNNASTSFYIGKRNDNANATMTDEFYGQIDEVRMWSVVRTGCEIQSYMNCEIAATANLFVNYHFNQGVAGGNNTALSSLTDSGSMGNNGSFNGFVLSGSTSNFVTPGSVTSGNITPAAPAAEIDVRGNGTSIVDGDVSPSTTDFTAFSAAASRRFYIYNTGTSTLTLGAYLSSSTDFSITSPPSATVAPGGSTSFVVKRVTASIGGVSAIINIINSDCTGSEQIYNFTISGNITTAASCIGFDGVDDYIDLGTTSTLKPTTDLTVEGWVYLADWSAATNMTFFGNAEGAGYEIFIQAGVLKGFVYRNGAYGVVSYPASGLFTGWHHLALTYNNRFSKLYIDGQLMSTDDALANYPIVYISNSTLIGAEAAGVAAPPTAGWYFPGRFDEVRFWNVERSQCDIQSFMGCEITSVAGLVTAFHFDQGTYNSSNIGQTSVTDLVSGLSKGTLTNYGTLTGTVSNWTAPGAIPSGATTSNPPSGVLSVKGNGSVILSGDVTPSAGDFTDFGSSVSTRTFVLSGSVAPVDLNTAYITGVNASEFSITVNPSGQLTNGGTASLVVAFTPTGTGARSATINIPSNDCTSPDYSFAVAGTAVAGAALQLDGADDYVDIFASLVELGQSDFTIEGWIKTTANDMGILSCLNGNSIWESGEKSFYIENNGSVNFVGYNSNYISSAYPVNDGNWHHVAVTWDNTGGVNGVGKIYVDGIDRTTASTYSANTLNLGTFKIGKPNNNETLSNFNGTVDDIRIWNIARTTCDIQNYMNCEIPTSATGLVGNYHFNSGVAFGVNPGISIASTSAGSNHGSLINFALTGANSNWVAPGGVITGSNTPAVSPIEIDVRGNGNSILDGKTTTSSVDFTDFNGALTRTFTIHNTITGGTLTLGTLSLTGADASQFSITTLPSASLISTSSATLVITFAPNSVGTKTATINIPNNDCDEAPYDFVISASASAGAALNFDGVNDQATVASGINLNNQSFTVEFWAKRGANGTNALVIGQGSTISQNQSLQIGFRSTNEFTFGFYLNDMNYTGTQATDGNFHHWACVYDATAVGKNRFIYCDGILVLNDVSVPFTGTGAFIIGDAGYGSNPYNGTVDELRVWNKVRSQCEIQTYMNCEIAGSQPGLTANYHFNQGISSSLNTSIASLIDDNTVPKNATLSNFTLNGSASNFITPGGVTSGNITSTPPAATLAIQGNGNSIAAGSTGPLLSNFTDFGPAATRTLVMRNTGTGLLYLNGATFTGANASSFSITTLPSATLTTGATSSFVISFTPSALGSQSAILNVFSSDCANPTYSFVITASTSAAAALNFDGTDDFVNVPNSGPLMLSTALSLEAWVKPTDNSGIYYVLSKGPNDITNGQYGIVIINGLTQFHFYDATGHKGITDNAPLPLGVWSHLAGTWDGTTMSLYVNGILKGTFTYTLALSPNTSALQIGRAAAAGYQFNGSIDEIRIWNTGRSQCQILSYMNCEIPGASAGLVANYHFNQGFSAGANLTVTTLADDASTNNGTLGGFNLNSSSTSNWVSPGGVVSNFITTSVPTGTINVSGNGNNVPIGIATSTANFTDFGTATSRIFGITNPGTGLLYFNGMTFSGANASSFSVTTIPSGTVAGGATSSVVISFTPTAAGSQSAIVNIFSSDCTNPTYSFVITASTAAASALNFDGSGDFISLPLFSFPSNKMTVEAWIKPTDITTNSSYEISRQEDTPSPTWILSFQNNGTLLSYGLTTGGSYTELQIPITAGHYTDGNWHHVAAVYDGAYKHIYSDGILIGSEARTGALNAGSALQHFIGSSVGLEYFNGAIDEVRYWNAARTQCEIQTYMNAEIPTTATGLIANYHFNQGVPSGNNTSVTSLVDAAGTNTGTLSGFALTGAVSNWVSPGGVVSGFTTAATPAQIIGVTGNGAAIAAGSPASSLSNFTDFDAATTRTFVIQNTGGGTLQVNSATVSGAGAANFSITGLPAGSLTSLATSDLVVAFTPTAIGNFSAVLIVNGSDCSVPDFSFVITATATSAAALSFDGNTSYVDLGSGGNLKPASALTAETWVFSSNWPSTDQTIFGNTENAGFGLFTRATGQLEGLVRRNSAWGTVDMPLSGLSAGWHHVGLVYTGQITNLYVDGVLKASDDAGSAYPIDYIANNTLIGAEASTGSAPVPGWYFSGKVDELRIWNRALCQAEITSNMNCEVSATGNGLIANYHFNQGIASGLNSTQTLLTDASGNAYNGTLTAMSLSGSSSNWISPGAITSGSSCLAFTAPEIDLIGNGISIPDGSSTASLTNQTDFGSICSNTTVVRTYTIQNTGSAPLTINTMSISGAGAASFTIGSLSPASPVPTNTFAVFSVTFAPGTGGIKTATINIANSDCDESLYDFVIKGTANAIPIVTANISNSVVCEGTSVTLTGAGADTYSWNPPAVNGTPFVPAITQAYTLSGTYTLTGCTSTNLATTTVVVNAIPAITVSAVNTAICSGNTAVLTASGAGAGTYTWNPGALNGATVNPAPAVNTTYSVSGTSTAGCTSTNVVTQLITVNATPTINATSVSTAICEGAAAILSVNGASTYSWNPGALTGGTITVSPALTTTFTAVGYGVTGCVSTNSISLTVTVNALPTVIANATQTEVCSGFTAAVFGSGADTYTWNPFIINGASFVPAATSSYTVAGTNTLTGCTSTNLAVQTIIVDNTPTVSIASSTLVICEGGTVTFTASGAASYTWNPGLSNATVLAVSPSTLTTYTLTGASPAGCSSTNTATEAISVNALPVVTASVSSAVICAGQSITLSGGGAVTYAWTNSAVDGIAFAPASSATYAVAGTNSAGCTSTNAAAVSVTVNALPIVTASVSNALICEGQSITLSGGGAVTYAWTNSAVDGVAFAPASSATYAVAGTNSAGCTSTNAAAISVTVNALPVMAINATNPVICSGDVATLTASGAGAGTYTWNPGALNGATVNPAPAVNTTYSVSGTSTAGCTSTNVVTQLITVNATPTINSTSVSTAICEGAAAILSVNGASTYSWNPGALTGGTVTVSPALTTTFTAVGYGVTGCVSTNSISLTVTVNALPTVTANATQTEVCSGFTAAVFGSGADTYTWNPFIINGASFVPAATSSYTVAGTNTLTGCTSTNLAVQTIIVDNTPTVSIASSTLVICEGGTVTFTASGAASYTWNPGLSNATVLAVSPSTLTTYTLTGASPAGCSSTNTATEAISVNALPVVTASVSSAVICAGQSITLSGGGAVTYAWTNSAVDGIAFAPASSATYAVAGTNSAGCTSTNVAAVSVTVNALPDLTVTATSSAVCAGGTVVLSGSGASTYTWSNGIGNNVAFTPTGTAFYTLSATDANDCKNTTTATITVNSPPVLAVSGTPSLSCEAESATLTASGAANYTWSSGETTSSIVIIPTVTSAYTISAADVNSCTNTIVYTQSVVVCPGTFTAYAVAHDVSCKGKDDGYISIHATSSYSNATFSYLWNPQTLCPSNTCDSLFNLKSGSYPVTVKITYTLNGNLVKADSLTVNTLLMDLEGACDVNVFNGVTPNGDGINDVLTIKNIEEFPDNKVSVYNRWGTQMFEVKGYNNLDKAWPRRDDLSNLSANTYYYLIDLGNGSKLIKGWVELVKE